MRVLVTGDRGFVGRHVVGALEDRGVEVMCADKKGAVDLSDESWIPTLARERPEAIVHLASTCSTPGSVKRPISTFKDTVATAANVTELARLLNVPLILTSSVKARDGMTPYGAAKRMVETWALEYRQAFGLSVVINRPGTIYGPGQEGSDESGWIAWFLRAKKEGKTVTVDGDGEQVRDLLHVEDYVRLLLLQLDAPRDYVGRIWDVGGGTENVVSVIGMVRHLRLDYVLGPERYGDSRSYIGVNDVPVWNPLIRWQDSETFRDL